jgi:hypothetical protein
MYGGCENTTDGDRTNAPGGSSIPAGGAGADPCTAKA